MNELISIIIPTYNHAHYLERCLKSIENQTIKNYEIIIIDNHSIDNTRQIINKFKSLPIKYFLIKNDGIYAKSRNLGIKNSSGTIIAFLDSDDWWKSNKLYECYEIIKKGYDMIYHDLELIDQNNNRKQIYLKGRHLKYPKFKDLIINGNQINNSSVVIKKNVLARVKYINENKHMKAAEDYNTWIKVCLNNFKVYYLNKNLGFYQHHESGGSRKNMGNCTLIAIKEFKNLLSKNEYKKALSRIIYINAKFLFEKQDYSQSILKFKLSLSNATSLIKLKSLFYIIISKIKK